MRSTEMNEEFTALGVAMDNESIEINLENDQATGLDFLADHSTGGLQRKYREAASAWRHQGQGHSQHRQRIAELREYVSVQLEEINASPRHEDLICV